MAATPHDRPDHDGRGEPDDPTFLNGTEQRRVLDGLAALVEGHYVFPDAGRAHATHLRAFPATDRVVAADRFARRLTRHLRERDRHFTVTWGEPERLELVASRPDVGPAMAVERHGEVGVLRVTRFDDLDDPASAALARRSLAGLAGARGVLVDVRDNDGGWPSMVEYLLAPFTGPMPVHVVTFRSTGHPDLVAWTRPDPDAPRLDDVPVVVLVNRGTASAAESLAYTLRTLSRATVVGGTTVGAANPVELFADRSGFHVYVPTGAPIDPRTGTNWDQVGIVPDVACDDADALDVALRALASTEAT